MESFLNNKIPSTPSLFFWINYRSKGKCLYDNKSEARSTKFETNSNDQNTNDRNRNHRPWRKIVFVLNFELLNFGFVSNFEFRISCFLMNYEKIYC